MNTHGYQLDHALMMTIMNEEWRSMMHELRLMSIK